MLDTSTDVKSSASSAVIPSPATQVSSSVEDRAKPTDARPSFKHASSFEHVQQPRPLSKVAAPED